MDKEKYEINLILQEIKEKKHQLFLSWIKLVFGVIGGIAIFFIIQKPESLLNRQSSKETILRERAKLLLELRKEKDPEYLRDGLFIIKSTYPVTDNEWVLKFEKRLEDKANEKLLKQYLSEYEILKEEVKVIDKTLRRGGLSDWDKKRLNINKGYKVIKLNKVKIQLDSLESIMK